MAAKLDYLKFTADEVKNSDVDTGLYVGLEGYGEIAPNLYLCMEVGYVKPDGKVNILGVDIDTEVTFVPIELNLKYAIQAAPNFIIDLGAGVSYNYVKEKASALGVSASLDDWL
ncbi:MAG: hypothetical protein FJ242_09295 [Nitrospira sp.]|nr:hypothetical protein [Nitrospira sp.]